MARALAEESIQEASKYRRITFEEFLRWDGEDSALEWVDGRIIEMPPVSDRHAEIVWFLGPLLRLACDVRGLGVIRGEPFVMRTIPNGPGRSPDLLFVAATNIARIDKLYLNGPADIAIEVVSPGSLRLDYVVKRNEYEKAAIPEYWIIDPLDEKATFLTLDETGRYIDAGLDETGLFVSRVLDSLSINPTWFHSTPMPSVQSILKEWGIL